MHSFKLALIIILSLPAILTNLRGQDQKLIENFTDRIIKDNKGLDSVEVRFVKEGIGSICEFLLDKDKNKFTELDQRAKNVDEVVNLATEIYNTEMMELARDYFVWADGKAKAGTGIYSFLETPHYLFYYPEEYGQDKIDFISGESEKLYESLSNIFKPDSSMTDNFGRLYMYESWANKNFKERTGALKPTNGKFVIVLMNNRKQMLDIMGKSPSGWTLAYTDLGIKFLPEKNRVVNTWVSYVPYFSSISLTEVTHEITHSYTNAIYSHPSVLDDYMKEHKLTDFSLAIPESVYVYSFPRPNILTIEGVAVWAGFEFTPLTKIGFLPNSRQAVRNVALPSLENLLKGNVDVAILGKAKNAADALFLLSGSFVGYITDTYSAEQLKALFTGRGEIISPSEIEQICGKPFKQIEKEWHDWMKK